MYRIFIMAISVAVLVGCQSKQDEVFDHGLLDQTLLSDSQLITKNDAFNIYLKYFGNGLKVCDSDCKEVPTQQPQIVPKELKEGTAGAESGGQATGDDAPAVKVAEKKVEIPQNVKEYVIGGSSRWLNQRFINDLQALTTQEAVRQKRNEMIDDLFILSEFKYNRYKRYLFTNKKVMNLSTEIYAMGLTSIATFTQGSTPNILAAAATFLLGAQEKVDESFFASKTIEALINIMDAQKFEVKQRIIAKKESNIIDYTIHDALNEIMEYHNRGNLLNALTVIHELSATKKTNAKQSLNKIESAVNAAEKKKIVEAQQKKNTGEE